MSKILTGGCLCGAVAYESTAEPTMVGHCHCVDCRRTSGAGHATHIMMREDLTRITGAMTDYARRADSGNIVTRSFCSVCGSPIASTNSKMPGMIFLRASSLDDPDSVTPKIIVFASRAPKWDIMDASLPSFAEMPENGPAEVSNDEITDA